MLLWHLLHLAACSPHHLVLLRLRVHGVALQQLRCSQILVTHLTVNPILR